MKHDTVCGTLIELSLPQELKYDFDIHFMFVTIGPLRDQPGPGQIKGHTSIYQAVRNVSTPYNPNPPKETLMVVSIPKVSWTGIQLIW